MRKGVDTYKHPVVRGGGAKKPAEMKQALINTYTNNASIA